MRRPKHDDKLLIQNNFNFMFESFISLCVPVIKDLLWAAAGMLLTYAFNKFQTQFN